MGSRDTQRIGQHAWWRNAIAALLLALSTLLAPVSAQAAESLKGVALVIGNGDYEHLSKLANPENDANDVEELLSMLGFDTTATTDRDVRRLKRDLEGFAEDAEGADVAVLYYSGHGIEAGGKNFLVPVDADISSLDNAGENLVPIDALIDKLKAEVPIVIVMLDACRNNPFPADAVVKLSPDDAPQPIAVSGLGSSRSAVSLNPTASSDQPPDANVGTVLAFAAEPGKVALDGNPGENSPYAAALIRHLSAMTGDEFGMVMRMVAEEVYLKTGGQQRPWVNESMRRLLYLGKTPDQPTGAEGDILSERRGLLVTIAALPDPQRRTIETIAADSGVPMDALYGMLRALGSEVPSDPKELDALLRGQTEKVKAMIAERDTLMNADPEIVRLSNLADLALSEGALNTAITLRQMAKARAREVEATVEDAEAQLKQRRIELAAVYSKSAEAYALAFKHREAATDYEEAARQVEKWDDEQAFWYTRSAATAYLEAGKLRGGAPDLEKAVEAGKRAEAMAIRLLADNPGDKQYWEDNIAQTINNLANASSSLFSATKRRSALLDASEAYERSLKVLSRDRVPEDWVVVQHNLAGVQMMLGDLDGDNQRLEQAIEAYRQALTVWTRQDFPERWALAISGMGNTQTLLGQRKGDKAMLQDAIASLRAALDVQTLAEMPLDWAWTQRQLADTYAALANVTRDANDVKLAIAAGQEALKGYTLERTPRLWAQTMHNMATASLTLSSDATRQNDLRKTAAIYEQIIAAVTPDGQPNEYGLSAGNLGSTLVELGKIDKDQPMVERGITLLREVIDLYDREQRPVDLARNLMDLGGGLVNLGNMRSSISEPQQALTLYDRAEDLYRQIGDDERLDYARRQRAFAHVELGYQKSKAGDHAGAVSDYSRSLELRDREKDASSWLFSANQVAIALQSLGASEQGVETLRKAVDAYRLALSATPPANHAGWIETQRNLISALRLIGERTNAADDYRAIADAYAVLVAAMDKTGERAARDLDEANRAWALAYAGELGSDPTLLRQSVDAYRAVLKSADVTGSDWNFHALNFIRTLFLASNLGGGDVDRREAITATDTYWPLFNKESAPEQKVNLLLDRANLMAMVAANDRAAYSVPQTEGAYRRAIAAADPKLTTQAWRTAQQALATYQLADLEKPGSSTPQISAGLDTLRTLYDATPKQADPQAWAELANWYGYALTIQGNRDKRIISFESAVPILRDALATFEGGNNARSAAHTRDSLCIALVGLGRLQKQRALIADGVENCAKAEAFMRENMMTDVLPIVEANLAEARKALIEVGGTQQ